VTSSWSFIHQHNIRYGPDNSSTQTDTDYFNIFNFPSINQIQKYINIQLNAPYILWCTLFTIFSPTCFGPYSSHFRAMFYFWNKLWL